MISEPLLHKMKILVVDDDQMTVKLLEQLLQRRGYNRVLGITDSRNALDTCTNFDPDLILLDLIMPDVDGFSLLEALRSDASETFLPIVVLTADVSEEAKARALEARATGRKRFQSFRRAEGRRRARLTISERCFSVQSEHVLRRENRFFV